MKKWITWHPSRFAGWFKSTLWAPTLLHSHCPEVNEICSDPHSNLSQLVTTCLLTFWHRLVDLFNFLSSVDCKDQVSTFQAWDIDLQLETAERRKQSMVLCIAGILDQGSSWIWPRSNKQPEREAWKSVCRSSKWPSSPPDPWHWASVHMCPFL